MRSPFRPYRLSSLLDPLISQRRLVAAGMSEHEAAAKGKLFSVAAKALLNTGSMPTAPALAVFVPGRIEVLGKHTDYCGGRSLLCTVERGLCFVATSRPDRQIQFNAIDMHESVQMLLDRDLDPAKRHWSNYPMTVARRIAENFPEASVGASIAMTGDLPAASGLSSSSGMIIGTFSMLSALNSLNITPAYRDNIATTEDLVGYLGCIENGQSFRNLTGDVGVGTFGGSQDHTAILRCKPGILSVYSFCPVKHERDIAFPDDLRFVITNSGVIAEKTGDALDKYNAVATLARQLVSIWNAAADRQASCLREAVDQSGTGNAILGQLIDSASPDDPTLRARLLSRLHQFESESQRIIPNAVDAFAACDWNQFRKLVNESQARAEVDLQNQIPQTIALQRSLMASGAIAASAFGAGFGGSVWALYSDDVLQGLDLEGLAGAASAFITRPGCGVTEIADSPT